MSLGKRNRQVGHKLERDIVQEVAKLLSLVPYNGKNVHEAEIGTTRVFSKALDNAKVDIWMKDNIFDLNLQAKCTNRMIKYHELLNQLPKEGQNVIIHRFTKKVKTKFVKQGEYALMPLEVFYNFLKLANERKVL